MGDPHTNPIPSLERAHAAISTRSYEHVARFAHELADNPDQYSGRVRAEALTILADG
jgi:hypothetical protein